MTKGNPAEYPENGPGRLFLERSAETQRYDQTDWPGSANFHPPHIRKLFEKPLKQALEIDTEDVEGPSND